MANRHKVQKLARGGKAHKEPHEEREHEEEHEAGVKRGGRAHRAEGGRVTGKASGQRLDRRARGGGVGSDKHPFSSAHVSAPPAHNPAPHRGKK